MLRPDVVVDVAKRIPRGIPVYLYTARVDDLAAVRRVLPWLNGITVTLHEQRDVNPFFRLAWSMVFPTPFSKRLNVFCGVDLGRVALPTWKIKSDIDWIPKAPLPEGETLMRL
jgi:hypothetical protein